MMSMQGYSVAGHIVRTPLKASAFHGSGGLKTVSGCLLGRHIRTALVAIAAQRHKTARSIIVAAANADHVVYTIRCKPHPVQFGQSLAIVSNVHDWNVDGAIVLEWKEGDIWEGCMDVPVDMGAFEFKLVTVGDDGVLEWESSENKTVKVFKKDLKKGASVECEWNSSNAMVISSDGKTKKTTAKKKKSTASVAAPEQQEEEEVLEMDVQEPSREDEERETVNDVIAEEHTDNNSSSSTTTTTVPIHEEGDVVTYTFQDDIGNDGESAADMARRMYG